MKVHLNQIPPGGLHIDGEEDCPLGDLVTQEIRCVGPLRYNLDLGISDGALVLVRPAVSRRAIGAAAQAAGRHLAD